MIITCTECQTRFRLADEKIKPGGSRVRCSVCQNVFTVLPAAEPAAILPAAATSAGDELASAAEKPAEMTSTTDRQPPASESAGAGDKPFAFVEKPSFPEQEKPFPTPSEDADLAKGVAFAEGTDEDGDRFDFDEETDSSGDGMDLGGEDDSSAAGTSATDLDFANEWATGWEQPETEAVSFDFNEPSFSDQSSGLKRGEAGLSFDEIEFTSTPDRQPPGASASPGEAFPPASPSISPAQPPLPASAPPSGDETLPAATAEPAKSRALPLLVLLLILCAIGGYISFTTDGQQRLNQLLATITGEPSAVPDGQQIGLEIAGSSYVNNQEAGQLLVIQGSAINNFATARSALTVKGVILDAGGKVLQQQTAFCGNYLDDGQLRGYRYAQIEEAMNNQFGAGLANMNVKPGKAIPFTIVFRNVPKEMANIHVEVVDSKAGGL